MSCELRVASRESHIVTVALAYARRRPNSLPSVTGDADWRAERNAFVWTIDTIDADSSTGNLEFRCDGDADAFFPVNIGFVASGSIPDVEVGSASSALGSG